MSSNWVPVSRHFPYPWIAFSVAKEPPAVLVPCHASYQTQHVPYPRCVKLNNWASFMRVNCLKFEKFARLSRPYPSSKPNEATTKRHCTRDFLSLDDFSFNDTLLFFKLRQLILVCNLSLLTQIPLLANSKINRLKTSMRKYLNLFSTCYFIAGRGRDSFIAIMRQQEHVLLIHQ